MRRRWLSILLCLHVCLAPAAAAAQTSRKTAAPAAKRTRAGTADERKQDAGTRAQTPAVSVDEAATRVRLEGRGRVSLSVSNATGVGVASLVTLELLDPADKIAASQTHQLLLPPGTHALQMQLPLTHEGRPASSLKDLAWYRLRYRVAPQPRTPDAPAHPEPARLREPVEGLVSLAAVAAEMFELRVAAPRRAREGQLFRVRARAINPVTSRPVSGARVSGRIKFDDAAQAPLAASGTTGADGYAALDFKLPPQVSGDEAELEISARLGGLERTASDEIEFDRSVQFLVTTDKPLYQPGQTLHVRALMLDAARRALPGVSADLEIEDEDGTTVFNAELKTSRFGVASADWPIPEGARLGEYRLLVETDDPRFDDDETEGSARVRVSRYELPNFTVAVKPDRAYYLPGVSASVEVRAEYLFGQPVRRGRVRVVRETERRWNFEQQKYEVEEGAKYEGEFDAGGRFVARVALSDEHAKLAEQTWSRFEDASFAAYVTDPTTNRTEQRRFSLRLSRDPVHVYVTEGGYRQAEGLPLALYVSTYYPDGTPAECEVAISEHRERPGPAANAAGGTTGAAARPVAVALRTIKTNRYGVAKVAGPVLARGAARREKVSLRFEARDRAGRAGSHDEDFWFNRGHPTVRVETDKPVYAPGEPVEVLLSSDDAGMRLHFDVAVGGRLVRSETVRLAGGRARLTVPYRPEFQGRVTFAAYTTELPEDDWDNYARGARTVVFPHDRELKFDVRFTRATYEPGAEASADLRVSTAGGRAAESALGVVVFDKAVEERARTDAEFSSSYGFSDSFYSFWYGPESIGGVSLRDLERLDPRKPRPSGFDTVAELLLAREWPDYRPNVFNSNDDADENAKRAAFTRLIESLVRDALAALAARHRQGGDFPADAAALDRLLKGAAGLSLADLRDPWGTPLRPEFVTEQHLITLRFLSAGPDEQFGTEDDLRAGRAEWFYFRAHGLRLSGVVEEYARPAPGRLRDASTHLRDPEVLKRLLAARGLDFAALRDPWGRPYDLRFEVWGAQYVFRVVSAGPDGRFEPPERYHFGGDDFSVWSIFTDYFMEVRALADSALAAAHKSRGRLPRDERELRELLGGVGVTEAQLRDPWGRDYYATFGEEARYADRTQTAARGEVNRTQATPVTQRVAHVRLRSDGPDGKRGTPDDFGVAEFSAVVSEQSAADAAPQPVAQPVTYTGATGAITGTVTDPQGAAVPGATVRAAHLHAPDLVFTAETDESGSYTLRNLPSGAYTVKIEAAHFAHAVFADVQVRAASLVRLDAQLTVGAITETVTVSAAGVEELNATSVMTVTKAGRRAAGPPAQRPPVTTPRLRKDFPETLYWQPELVTDKSGRAQLKFKLADNITTWKVSVIGSTETGELGTAEREIRAFQPFFVELEPPRVLTEGDEISLPVVLRNYLESAQRVALDLKPEDWFTLIGPAAKTADVAAGDSARATFDLRAVASVKEGRQRVTAVGAGGADAVEKPVHVHPDGEEIAATETQLFESAASLSADVPAHVIPRSARAELKVYPNLMAHAFESVEAVMSRPNGCGEQTISSAYPSLLVLRHHLRAQGGAGDGGADLPPAAEKARRYLRVGYERLLNYRTADGGFSYWGTDAPDAALTAYAARFLRDASGLIETDPAVLEGALRWLVSRQQPDGSWPAYEWDNKQNRRRTALLTAYVARVLAEHQRDTGQTLKTPRPTPRPNVAAPGDPQAASAKGATADAPDSPGKSAPDDAPLARALKYLAARAAEIDEPYLIASYLLASVAAGAAPAEIERTAARLRSLAREEAGGAYWALETNTPFYGWGLAGRIETTALAVQALAHARAQGLGVGGRGSEKNQTTSAAPSAASPSPIPQPPTPISHPLTPAHDEAVGRGLLFLLRNKDRYGVWLSTQATVNVLDALTLLSRAEGAAGGGRVEVFVNGRPAGALDLPAGNRSDAPLSLDLSPHIAAGAHRVELRRAGVAAAGPAAAAQLVTTYYVPWERSTADGRQASPRSSRALRLAVEYGRVRAGVGEEISCRVEAERIGHEGYGMLLAEVGLPPGAEVNRASLERAMKEAGWEFSRYDILPDRLVAYLWPRAGGTRFTFTFRPRLALRAKSAPSQVYDYYNPEARALLAPASFVVAETTAAKK